MRLVCVVLLGGCRSILGFEDVTAPGGDAGSDSSTDMQTDDGDQPVFAATRLALGSNHTCVLTDSERVMCWGRGDTGALGYGNTDDIGDDEAPRDAGFVVVGVNAIAIAAGVNHSCAVTAANKVRCWGANGNLQLGYPGAGTVGDTETPASIGDVALTGEVVEIAASGAHTCARLNTGTVRCWGTAQNGRLGYGNETDVADPSTAVDVSLGATATQIVAGGAHTCALLENQGVICWGLGGSGRLGYGNLDSIGDNETPSMAGPLSLGGGVLQLAAGGDHTCALRETKDVVCWGNGNNGQLGYGEGANVGDNELPESAGPVSLGGAVAAIAAGDEHTCALLEAGGVRCWGRGANGALGYGNSNSIGDNELPTAVGTVDVGGTVMRIAAGGDHTCALLATGAIRCWGFGSRGQLGYGNTDRIGDNETPALAGDVPYR